MGGGGQTTSTTTETNEPPAWARPGLERAGEDALRLYDQGVGYNVYRGPTLAPMSDPTLGGMNSLLAATGYQGPAVQNQAAQEMFPGVWGMIEQQIKDEQRKPKNGGGGGGGGGAGPQGESMHPWDDQMGYFQRVAEQGVIDQMAQPGWTKTQFGPNREQLGMLPGGGPPQTGPSFPPHPNLPPGLDEPHKRRR